MAAEGGVHGYYRQPSLHADTLVFVSEDDLWAADLRTASAPADSGGETPILAARLTSVASAGARAAHPAISPDGRWVAYTCDAGGARGEDDLWIVPVAGGRSRRLTFEGVRAEPHTERCMAVRGWTPDGSAVLYTTPTFSRLGDWQLALVNAFGQTEVGECSVLPLAQANDGVLARREGARANTLYFVRLPFQGSCSRGYRGGYVRQLWRWRVDGAQGEAALLTGDHPGASFNPMWDAVTGRVAFLSDRSGVTEVWSATPDGDELVCHSDFARLGLEARSASLSRGVVVVEASAELFLVTLSPTPTPTPSVASAAAESITGRHDAEGGEGVPRQLRALPLRLRSSRDATQPTTLAHPLQHLQSMAIAPDGSRAALVLRGRAFVVPVNGADSNGKSQNRAGRVAAVCASGHLRVRTLEYVWGDDDGSGSWLCCTGAHDSALPLEQVAPGDEQARSARGWFGGGGESQSETFETILERDGQLLTTLSDVPGLPLSSPMFEKVCRPCPSVHLQPCPSTALPIRPHALRWQPRTTPAAAPRARE